MNACIAAASVQFVELSGGGDGLLLPVFPFLSFLGMLAGLDEWLADLVSIVASKLLGDLTRARIEYRI